jgi:hypothetical protein
MRVFFFLYKDLKLDVNLKSQMTCMYSYLAQLLQSCQAGLEDLVAMLWKTGVQLVQGRRHLSLSLLMLLAPCTWKASLLTALAGKFPVSFSTSLGLLMY